MAAMVAPGAVATARAETTKARSIDRAFVLWMVGRAIYG
jgi:hypothetical protein